MIPFALLVVGATLASGLVAAAALRHLPTLGLQLTGLALLAVLLPLAAVVLSGVVMFESDHDLTVLSVAAAAATAAVAAALGLARSISGSLAPLRRAAAELAGGDLTARVPPPEERELAALATAFNEMAERLEELFDTRAQLVAWASHDLRTPLANMQAMLEAVEDGLAEPAHYLSALQEQVRTLGRLVDDLFELARIEAGSLTLELRDAQLSRVVHSCLRGLEAEAHARRVHLQADLVDGAVAHCEPDKVERVLLNLLTNALRHTPADGSIAVRVEPGEDEVQVTVEDTGIGLEPEVERRMFDRFWRADRARSSTQGGGSGLGLAIARGLVEAHGGRIWAENRPGGGARVAFTLPAPRHAEFTSP
jgi:signal transduction histidine kinase